MPDGNAYRPGDVLASLDGKTVEIINTDAEGRLVLADALAYARELEPDLMIDNATLTGACMVALGATVSGFYANRDDPADEFSKAAKEAGEPMWRMPLLEDLRDGLKSDLADLKHIGRPLRRLDHRGAVPPRVRRRHAVDPLRHRRPVVADKAYGFYPKGGTGHGVLTFLALIDDLATS